jgi:hypothetical protein
MLTVPRRLLGFRIKWHGRGRSSCVLTTDMQMLAWLDCHRASAVDVAAVQRPCNRGVRKGQNRYGAGFRLSVGRFWNGSQETDDPEVGAMSSEHYSKHCGWPPVPQALFFGGISLRGPQLVPVDASLCEDLASYADARGIDRGNAEPALVACNIHLCITQSDGTRPRISSSRV